MIPSRSLIAALLVVVAQTAAHAQEPAVCLSPDATQWPNPSKPYFMIIADTSSSLTGPVGSGPFTPSSCGLGSTRRDHLRCALRNAVTAYAGLANFGLATYATQQTGCDAACGTCTQSDLPGGTAGCGPGSGVNRAGANIVVPMLQDNHWTSPSNPSNAAQLLSWFDGSCTGNTELYAAGGTPLNGALRDMRRYFATQWVAPGGGPTYTTPLVGGAGGERACRSVNVILIADGDESCDTVSDAVGAAMQLLGGVTIGGTTFNIRVHVINFLGGNPASLDQIAAAGGTTSSYSTTNEATLTQALGSIITGNLGGGSEVCDNADNDCNGCTDEGFRHYCNVQPTPGQCCPWGTAGQRTTCLNNYRASITPGTPQGNKALLPCTTPPQQSSPSNWLCYEPNDTCDNLDNDCQDGVDEGIVKVGNPPSCP